MGTGFEVQSFTLLNFQGQMDEPENDKKKKKKKYMEIQTVL